MRAILKAALKSEELAYNLEEIIAVDDKVAVEEITDENIISEARYVLGKFTGSSGGFEQENDLSGDNGPELQKWARKEVRILKSFLNKWGK